MRIEPVATKRSVIMLWCISISGFLYLFSAGMESEISVMQFFNFCFLLFGGGAAYHVTTELLTCPQTDDNHSIWLSTLFILSKTFFGYLIAGISLYFALKFGGIWGWFLAFVGLVIGYFWVMHYILKLQEPIKKLIGSYNK
ncbi:MAG: hypothetical protein AB7S90_12470 [Marinobacterium sp.]